MFIELTDVLRCPANHPEGNLVVATGEMMGRSISHGLLGCPVCHAEFRIVQGIARFGVPDQSPAHPPVPDTNALHAFLGITSPGGYVVLVGSAAQAAPALSLILGGVHLIGINAPAGVTPGPMVSLLESSGMIPVRTSAGRGVIVGGERAHHPWLEEAARVVLAGQRIVVLSNEGSVDGVARMATGPGVWVGQKAGKGGKGR